MKPPQTIDSRRALKALKAAIIKGATDRYPRLVDDALQAGATDDDIDNAVHEAIELLFESAEQPVTSRDLASLLHTH